MPTLLSDGCPNAHASAGVPVNSAETVVALGRVLRRARELRGLTLQQVANETKIPQRRLEALESENGAVEPHDFYRRAEIRAYARAVHFDERLALTEFDRAAQASALPEAAPEPPAVPAAMFSATRLLILLGVVSAAALIGRAMTQPEPIIRRTTEVGPANTSSRQPAAIPQPQIQDVGRAPQRAQQDQPATSRAEISTRQRHPLTAAGMSAPARTDARLTQDQSATRAAANRVTELVVATQPEGARVTVNGIGWGIAPVTIRHLPEGVKRVRVSKDGYATEERVLHLTEGKPIRLVIRLSASGT